MTTMSAPSRGTAAGELIKQWRLRRRYSQLDLAGRAEVSTRHLSFVETGRAKPSPEMIVHLAEHLAVPLRERNQILLAAGYAPRYTQTTLDDPSMRGAQAAVEMVLKAHPYPAVVVDRYWNLLQTNAACAVLLDGIDPALRAPTANAIRLALHPGGLRRTSLNFDEYATHLMQRLRRIVEMTGDQRVAELHEEMRGYVGAAVADAHGDPGVVMPLALRAAGGELRLFSTISVFGSPLDVTLEELTIEMFYPADDESRSVLQRMISSLPS